MQHGDRLVPFGLPFTESLLTDFSEPDCSVKDSRIQHRLLDLLCHIARTPTSAIPRVIPKPKSDSTKCWIASIGPQCGLIGSKWVLQFWQPGGHSAWKCPGQ